MSFHSEACIGVRNPRRTVTILKAKTVASAKNGIKKNPSDMKISETTVGISLKRTV